MTNQKGILYALILLAGLILAWITNTLQTGPPVEVASRPAGPLVNGSAVRLSEDRVRLGSLIATIPDGWTMEPPSSSMRMAQFRLPAQERGLEDAELAVFTGIGGGTQSNLNRWFGQFQQPDGTPSEDVARVETVTREEVRVTVADLSGTFTGGGMPMSRTVNKPGYRLLAAIVETFQETYYFKVVGPEETVSRWAPTFTAFVGNLQVAGP